MALLHVCSVFWRAVVLVLLVSYRNQVRTLIFGLKNCTQAWAVIGSPDSYIGTGLVATIMVEQMHAALATRHDLVQSLASLSVCNSDCFFVSC